MDKELWKLILSQGVVAVLLFGALKWVLKDRDKGWQVASQEQKERIALLETTSVNRTHELKELRSEFSGYRNSVQIEFNNLNSKHSDQLIAVTAQYNKQLDGLQTEIRGLYKAMLEQRFFPAEKHIVDSTGH